MKCVCADSFAYTMAKWFRLDPTAGRNDCDRCDPEVSSGELKAIDACRWKPLARLFSVKCGVHCEKSPVA